MIIQSIEEALALPPGKWSFGNASGGYTAGNVNPEVLQRYGAELTFPVDATCQGQIITLGYLRKYPKASALWWELPEETP